VNAPAVAMLRFGGGLVHGQYDDLVTTWRARCGIQVQSVAPLRKAFDLVSPRSRCQRCERLFALDLERGWRYLNGEAE
jgi:hypothetical protein